MVDRLMWKQAASQTTSCFFFLDVSEQEEPRWYHARVTDKVWTLHEGGGSPRRLLHVGHALLLQTYGQDGIFAAMTAAIFIFVQHVEHKSKS